jgi:hypothetical protein
MIAMPMAPGAALAKMTGLRPIRSLIRAGQRAGCGGDDADRRRAEHPGSCRHRIPNTRSRYRMFRFK